VEEMTLNPRSTLAYLMAWLRRYAETNRPANVTAWRLLVKPRHNYFREGVQTQSASLVGVRGGRTILPLVEVWAKEQNRACSVTLRLNEVALSGYFEGLCRAIEQLGEVVPTETQIGGGLFGTCRDLTFDDVCAIVHQCREYKQKDGKVTEFFRRRDIVPGEPRSFELETLRGWLKDPRFRDC
jgi:hypothetical protein